MAFSITWHIPDRILLLTYHGDIDIDQIFSANQQGCEKLESVENKKHRIHIVIDMLTIRHLPVRLPSGWGMIPGSKHAKIGKVVLISKNYVARFLGGEFAKINHLAFRAVNTREEAFSLLQSTDSTLDFSANSLHE